MSTSDLKLTREPQPMTVQERPRQESIDYDNLKPHPLAEEYPMADDHEYEGLKVSIGKNGIRERIKLYRGSDGTPMILDGRNRHKAAKEAGHKFTPADFEDFTGTYQQAEVYVYETNNLRRHLSTAQKTEIVKKLLVKYPKMSSRKLSEISGVSHTTIANLRKPKEDKEFDTLSRAWQGANYGQQERFVEMYKIDLAEMLKA
jgi:ParB-like chromosome segregation protein Spo0J